MKLILHIGMPKSGTSSVQKTLYDQQESLSRQGFFLLNGLGKPNNNGFSGAFENFPNQHSRSGGHSKESWQRVVNERVRRFRDEVWDACRTHHTVMVTSEQMSRRFQARNIEELSSVVSPLFSSVDVVCSVRDQLFALPSLYWLSVKSGKETRPFVRWLREAGLHIPVLRYDELADRWAEVFGRENIKIMVFQEEEAWDAVSTFFASVLPDFEADDVFQGIQKKNRSGSALQTSLMRQINRWHSLGLSSSSESRKTLGQKKRALLEKTSAAGGFRPNRIGPRTSGYVVDHFRDSNLRLAQRYLGSDWPFRSQEIYLDQSAKNGD